jgi:hypothetical protein
VRVQSHIVLEMRYSAVSVQYCSQRLK